MNQLKLQITGLLIVAITCGGLLSWTREDEMRQLNNNSAVVADKCMEAFLKNMKNLGAIIYLPDTKLQKGAEFGLTPIEGGNTTEAYEFYSFFDQVQPVENPNDPCSPTLKINFDELQMVVFVDKTKSGQYSRSGVQKSEWKIGGIKYKLEEKHTLTEKLKIKITGNSTLTLVPVQFKLAER